MLYFAYHRTSTTDQHLDRGIKSINDFIQDRKISLHHSIFTDQCTGKNFSRPGYKSMKEEMLFQINQGNEVSLIVTELDRLGRNKQLTLNEIRDMQSKGIRLMVLEIPTTLIELPNDNNMSKMMMETINNMLLEMYASFAHAEMEKRSKRQREGIEAKKARNEWSDYGRPRALDFNKFSKEYKRVLTGDIKPTECMRLLGITKPTYYRYKKEYEGK
ncbi:recombinase family protein [Clostridium subterminale]|uniref:Recombinase family protein n=1 Tax=Clostridium subterminale TaxID=1550 RepID=A0ABP3VSY0_CLOSU